MGGEDKIHDIKTDFNGRTEFALSQIIFSEGNA